MKIETRKLVVISVLGAISIVLGLANLGIIYIPFSPAKATILHVPTIIGAIIEGPVAGALIGLIFGLYSMFDAVVRPTSVLSVAFLDPLVSIFPRILIGITAYYSYSAIKRILNLDGKNESIAVIISAVIGTLTNTVGVLGMLYLRHAAIFVEKMGIDAGLVGKTILGIAAVNGIPEIIIAAVIVAAVVKAVKRFG
ncbi:MAG: ECF transporter S component [Clostridia bacterium]|nr:ECF transporter S component [Clostridia bacterium]